MTRLAIALMLLLALSGCAGAYGSRSSSSDASSTGAPASGAPAVARAAPAPASTSPLTAPAAQVHSLADGLVYEDLAIGDGTMADPGLTAVVHYTGWLAGGTKFASSRDGNSPLEFVLGAGRVIRGWEEGIRGMRIGGKQKLTIPSDLAYGEEARPPLIPPRATLVFEVELLGVK